MLYSYRTATTIYEDGQGETAGKYWKKSECLGFVYIAACMYVLGWYSFWWLSLWFVSDSSSQANQGRKRPIEVWFDFV